MYEAGIFSLSKECAGSVRETLHGLGVHLISEGCMIYHNEAIRVLTNIGVGSFHSVTGASTCVFAVVREVSRSCPFLYLRGNLTSQLCPMGICASR